jgi:hypothetical protein
MGMPTQSNAIQRNPTQTHTFFLLPTEGTNAFMAKTQERTSTSTKAGKKLKGATGGSTKATTGRKGSQATSTYPAEEALFTQPPTTLKDATNNKGSEKEGREGKKQRVLLWPLVTELAWENKAGSKVDKVVESELDEEDISGDIRTESTTTNSFLANTDDPEISKFRELVRKNLFHRIKFIEKAESLEYGGTITKRMMTGMLGINNPKSYWSRYRGHTNKALYQKRRNVNNELKQAFFSKSKYRVLAHGHVVIFKCPCPPALTHWLLLFFLRRSSPRQPAAN